MWFKIKDKVVVLKFVRIFIGLFVVLGISMPCYSVPTDDAFDFMDDEYYDDFSDTDDVTFSDSNDTDSVFDAQNMGLNDGAGLINVGGFDIAGIMLGMSFEDVYNLYYNQGNLYSPRRRNSLVYTIPQDWKYNLDYECRQAGVFQPNKLDKCIKQLAKNRGLLYISEIHLERAKTGETIDVYLTSNATDNVVYKIVYNNDADEFEGQDSEKTSKFSDQRDKKIMAFWKTVLKKYGNPNSGQDTWITSTNTYDPKMTAYYGSLELVDEGRHAMDVATAAKQSGENFHAKPYAF